MQNGGNQNIHKRCSISTLNVSQLRVTHKPNEVLFVQGNAHQPTRESSEVLGEAGGSASIHFYPTQGAKPQHWQTQGSVAAQPDQCQRGEGLSADASSTCLVLGIHRATLTSLDNNHDQEDTSLWSS